MDRKVGMLEMLLIPFGRELNRILQISYIHLKVIEMEINKKNAILTGASSGLGSAIAKALIEKGAKVYGLARNLEALKAIKAKLGSDFIPVQLDISENSGVEKWITETFSETNSPDILINNAGLGSFGKIDEIPAEEWLGMVNTNLNGMYYITAQVTSLMKKKKEVTHIVNIGSILGTMGRAESAAYCTTKFGVQGFSESLFKELRFFDIKVTCLNPGSIDTKFFQNSGVEAHQNMLQPQDLANMLVHVLETPDNMLINELTVRPLNPKSPNDS